MTKLLGSLMTMTSSNINTSPVVRLHSLNSVAARENNLRVMHIVRHAEGYHNVNTDYRNPNNLDATLTEDGIEQCKQLSRRLQDDEHFTIDCIISSPMRRALQTAYHSFEHILEDNSQDIESSSKDNKETIPFVACEHWRETVNYVCDIRIPRSQAVQDFPYADFGNIEHEDDPIWKYYEDKFGSLEKYTKTRESVDDIRLSERGKRAWRTIAQRPEQSLAVVSHSAFFFHMFTRPELGIVSYEDDAVKQLMEDGFENCEMRSLAFEIL